MLQLDSIKHHEHSKSEGKYHLGNRRFEVDASIFWYNFPYSLKSITSATTFSKCLKTHLMEHSFEIFLIEYFFF